MYAESQFQGRYRKPSKGLYRQQDERAWGQVFEERIDVNRSSVAKVKPLYAIGEEVTMHDGDLIIEAEVVNNHCPNRFELVDAQGFFHLAEVIPVSEQNDFGLAQLRAIVSPKHKYAAGYKQSVSNGVSVIVETTEKVRRQKVINVKYS